MRGRSNPPATIRGVTLVWVVMIGLALCLLGFLYYINPKSIEPPPRVETLTDLSNLLIRWEKHASEDSAVALGKLAAQLDRAGELLEAADHARPPPAASPCPSCPSCPACPATTASLAGAAAGAGAGAASEAALLHALATAGVQCHAGPAELWGEPLVWGSVHRTPSAAECCAACAAHAAAAARGGLEEGVNSTACNTWWGPGGGLGVGMDPMQEGAVVGEADVRLDVA
ncbi:hypothetical protein HYH03_016284 [Edaphochlamys debaryana]|uniref:Uncharacterized protein n=1 Tax=Edaphochlamys debaryana TaxID=47281 RepID=A0A836BQ36_9CHLO|nr:hypothetical protein HYH03_016284 [Edaphochlamys debaryana]|eukprot:KAG2484991.1 hypothetical protein HYH03_016284 [Edaphochlamys debaryana]